MQCRWEIIKRRFYPLLVRDVDLAFPILQLDLRARAMYTDVDRWTCKFVINTVLQSGLTLLNERSLLFPLILRVSIISSNW